MSKSFLRFPALLYLINNVCEPLSLDSWMSPLRCRCRSAPTTSPTAGRALGEIPVHSHTTRQRPSAGISATNTRQVTFVWLMDLLPMESSWPLLQASCNHTPLPHLDQLQEVNLKALIFLVPSRLPLLLLLRMLRPSTPLLHRLQLPRGLPTSGSPLSPQFLKLPSRSLFITSVLVNLAGLPSSKPTRLFSSSSRLVAPT
uniref:Uncharacterized protein n=1 Tax=Chromera velia CCMP2878 TaxID=1169474 RepID=A0A0G4GDD3_9ALVE|eukprot:Cvel_634.t1-p1 / transcript=Cvel_634.t1 / gene=Cvel_634 / organism=Chromera_velia_CCMP2878 / gene_product=hypothetical protein / transcript_product=hypothetical protein / location=Cvel_scaffold19:138798-142271(-) / protein_length=199 / sequence_SO=supercontig / SO=protein_coding / is_pseudo=false